MDNAVVFPPPHTNQNKTGGAICPWSIHVCTTCRPTSHWIPETKSWQHHTTSTLKVSLESGNLHYFKEIMYVKYVKHDQIYPEASR